MGLGVVNGRVTISGIVGGPLHLATSPKIIAVFPWGMTALQPIELEIYLSKIQVHYWLWRNQDKNNPLSSWMMPCLSGSLGNLFVAQIYRHHCFDQSTHLCSLPHPRLLQFRKCHDRGNWAVWNHYSYRLGGSQGSAWRSTQTLDFVPTFQPNPLKVQQLMVVLSHQMMLLLLQKLSRPLQRQQLEDSCVVDNDFDREFRRKYYHPDWALWAWTDQMHLWLRLDRIGRIGQGIN